MIELDLDIFELPHQQAILPLQLDDAILFCQRLLFN